MAKFTPGIAVGAISGAIGGTVWSRNRYGVYCRVRAIPVNPSTEAQDKIRGLLSAASMAWQQLAANVQTAWNTWAQTHPVIDALGAQQILTGQAAFVQIQVAIAYQGFPGITEPPVKPAPTACTALTLTADIGAGGVKLAFTPTPFAAGCILTVDAAVVSSKGIKYVRNLMRYVGATADASPFNIKTIVETKFGTLAVGQTLFVRARILDTTTGLYSGPRHGSAAVVTT